jgi:hypothetical protein
MLEKRRGGVDSKNHYLMELMRQAQVDSVHPELCGNWIFIFMELNTGYEWLDVLLEVTQLGREGA